MISAFSFLVECLPWLPSKIKKIQYTKKKKGFGSVSQMKPQQSNFDQSVFYHSNRKQSQTLELTNSTTLAKWKPSIAFLYLAIAGMAEVHIHARLLHGAKNPNPRLCASTISTLPTELSHSSWPSFNPYNKFQKGCVSQTCVFPHITQIPINKWFSLNTPGASKEDELQPQLWHTY